MNDYEVSPTFEKWATSYSGCVGGDAGSITSRSTWFCGIEWGVGHDANELDSIFSEDMSAPPLGYENWRKNLEYRFDWQAMKLLAVIEERQLSAYKVFAEEVKPFTVGASGYFRTNLYPLAFRTTNRENWVSAFSQATGIRDKDAYIEWIRARRFPIMRSWARMHKPKLIICTGITYLEDFQSAFGDEGMEFENKAIDDRQLYFGKNLDGTLIVVIPFMLNRYGLTRNTSIQKFAEEIRSMVV